MARCAECTFFKFCIDCREDDVKRRYRCSKYYKYVWATDYSCSEFCEDSEKTTSDINNAIEEAEEWKVRHESPSYSPCYLTTITCALLGMPDNNIYLKTLREFRDNVMQKDPKYFKLLAQYDIVGPVIARRLAEDPARGQIAKNLLELGIKTTVLQIKENKYDEAVQTYSTMTELLIDGCRIKREAISSEVINSMDIAKSGHGKVMLKTTPKTV